MADLQADSIVEALGSVSSRKEQLHKALTEFDSRKSVIAKFTLKWKELQDHFTDIEKVVNTRVADLRSKEQAFEAKSKKLFEDFAKREEAVFQREQASLTRVQERKDSNAKPQAIAAANGSSAQPMDLDLLHVATSDDGAAKNASTDKVASISAAKVPLSEVKVRAELKSLCENMDSDGIKNYIAKQTKDIASIRAELPSALQLAADPSRLVLRALDSYPLQENNSRKTKKMDVGALVIARVCVSLLEALAKVLVDPLLGEAHIVVPSDIKASAKEIANKWKSKMDLKADASTGGSINAQAFLQLLATFGMASEYDADEICDLVVILARRKQTLNLCKFLDLSPRIPDIVDKLCNENRQVEALSFANAFGIMYRLHPVALLKDYLKAARKSAHYMAKRTNTPVIQHNSVVKELSALKAVLKCIEEYKLEAQYSSAPLQRRVDQLEKFISDKKRAADDLKAQEKRPKVSSASGVQSSSVLTDSGLSKATEKYHYTSANLSPYGLSTQNTYNSIMPSASYTVHTGGRDPLSISSSYLQSSNALGSQLYGSSDPTHTGGRDLLSLYGSSDPTHTGGRDLLSLSSSYLQSSNTLGSQVYGSSAYSNPSSTYSSYHFGGGLPPPPPAYQSLFPH